MRSLFEDKRGNIFNMMPNLLMLFMVIVTLIALIPGMMEMINTAQRSDSLNCNGYTDDTASLSYNSSKQTSTIGCLAIKLFVPYIVLGVLIAGVAYIFYGQSMQVGGGQQQQY